MMLSVFRIMYGSFRCSLHLSVYSYMFVWLFLSSCSETEKQKKHKSGFKKKTLEVTKAKTAEAQEATKNKGRWSG